MGHSCRNPHSTCVLDCIYNDECRTYFILDMLVWKGMQMYASPADVRFVWMETVLREWDAEIQEEMSRKTLLSSDQEMAGVCASCVYFPCCEPILCAVFRYPSKYFPAHTHLHALPAW